MSENTEQKEDSVQPVAEATPLPAPEPTPALTADVAPPEATKPALSPAEQEARKAFAAESGKARQELISKVDAVFAAWQAALGEPGKAQPREMTRHEKELRSLLDQFRKAQLTRKDRHRLWTRYQQAWQELIRLKEQASLAARAYFQSQADEITASLQNDGPELALTRLKQVQKERAGYILSKSDWDEVKAALERVFLHIREEAKKQSPWYKRLSAAAIKERHFLARLQRQADMLRSVIADTKKQWETEDKSALRAALLKERLTSCKADLARLDAQIAVVRAGVEKLESRMKKAGALRNLAGTTAPDAQSRTRNPRPRTADPKPRTPDPEPQP